MIDFFQNNLYHYILISNYNLYHVSSLIGVTQSTLINYIHGIEESNINTISLICKVLNITPNDLFNDKNYPKY